MSEFHNFSNMWDVHNPMIQQLSTPLNTVIGDDLDQKKVEENRKKYEEDVNSKKASELFSTIVLFCDEYLKEKQEITDEDKIIYSFFKIASTLPMELQMTLVNRVYGLAKDTISPKNSEEAFHEILFDYRIEDAIREFNSKSSENQLLEVMSKTQENNEWIKKNPDKAKKYFEFFAKAQFSKENLLKAESIRSKLLTLYPEIYPVKVKLGDGEIYVLKKQLADLSLKYKNFFKSTWFTESTSTEIIIDDEEPSDPEEAKINKEFLEYLKTGEVDIRDDNAFQLILLADFHIIPKLLHDCVKFLVEAVTLNYGENYPTILKFAQENHLTDLEKEVKNVIPPSMRITPKSDPIELQICKEVDHFKMHLLMEIFLKAGVPPSVLPHAEIYATNHWDCWPAHDKVHDIFESYGAHYVTLERKNEFLSLYLQSTEDLIKFIHSGLNDIKNEHVAIKQREDYEDYQRRLKDILEKKKMTPEQVESEIKMLLPAHPDNEYQYSISEQAVREIMLDMGLLEEWMLVSD